MSYPDYAMSQGGDEDGADFGYLEFEAGTQDSQYEYSDFAMPSQQTQQHGGTQDDLNFASLSLGSSNHHVNNGALSQSDFGHEDHYHNHSPGSGNDPLRFEEMDEQEQNDQPLALTELPPHACKYVFELPLNISV